MQTIRKRFTSCTLRSIAWNVADIKQQPGGGVDTLMYAGSGVAVINYIEVKYTIISIRIGISMERG